MATIAPKPGHVYRSQKRDIDGDTIARLLVVTKVSGRKIEALETYQNLNRPHRHYVNWTTFTDGDSINLPDWSETIDYYDYQLADTARLSA